MSALVVVSGGTEVVDAAVTLLDEDESVGGGREYAAGRAGR